MKSGAAVNILLKFVEEHRNDVLDVVAKVPKKSERFLLIGQVMYYGETPISMV